MKAKKTEKLIGENKILTILLALPKQQKWKSDLQNSNGEKRGGQNEEQWKKGCDGERARSHISWENTVLFSELLMYIKEFTLLIEGLLLMSLNFYLSILDYSDEVDSEHFSKL